MKIAYIATYPPRQCGIGTFTKNLYKSMLIDNENINNKGFIVALDSPDTKYNYPEEVEFTIRQEQHEDYKKAAEYINRSGADLCILEHEFGIFGGDSGLFILTLLNQLDIPLIVTLHTILKAPSYDEKLVTQEICKIAQKVIVMSYKAIEFLENIYKIPDEKIVLIEHGVPDLYFDSDESKKELKLDNKKVILTFGFVGRGKGIETVIKALPKLVAKHPNVLYIVLGKTHPNVLKHSGEEYRLFLMNLVKNLKLEKHVKFLNEFVDQQDLFKYLYSCDIYITPYLNEAQITSGTLSYAVGVGAAVLSTPYWHAEELLSKGRGRLFNFNDAVSLSLILTELFENPEELNKLKNAARLHGKEITWTKTGNKYLQLAQNVLIEGAYVRKSIDRDMDLANLPPFSLDHIKRLTDDTGIIQHAKFGIPNLKEGYCLDDNARALIFALMVYQEKKDPEALELSTIYLRYINYMQNADGTFRNFMSYNRSFSEETGSEDSFGRAVWALGYLICHAPFDAHYQYGKDAFFRASPHFSNLKSIRSIANTMIGVSYYLRRNPSHNAMLKLLRTLSNKLKDHYTKNKTPEWHWFEPILAYDNGILPLALLHASEILHDEKITSIALESMNFLTETTFRDNHLSIIGNEKWYKKDGERAVYDQQPVDAMAMVLMYHQAFVVTKDKGYFKKLYNSFLWFLGENDLRLSLFDTETSGCCDGLRRSGINRNQGAESTLAYVISHLTVLQAYDSYYSKFNRKAEAISNRRRKTKLSQKKYKNTDVSRKISKQSHRHKKGRTIPGSYSS